VGGGESAGRSGVVWFGWLGVVIQQVAVWAAGGRFGSEIGGLDGAEAAAERGGEGGGRFQRCKGAKRPQPPQRSAHLAGWPARHQVDVAGLRDRLVEARLRHKPADGGPAGLGVGGCLSE